jgi:hypothetical protein
MAPTASFLSRQLRKFQEADPVTGEIFKAVHEVIDRTIAKFFPEDADLMPHPVVSFEVIHSGRLAEYYPRDGYTMADRINVDPFKVRNGIELPELLAHELVHVWENHLGYPFMGTHERQFHDKMLDFGIVTEGLVAQHTGYMGDVWQEWMDELADLHLGRFQLGPVGDETHVTTWRCPDCNLTVMTHERKLSLTCSQTPGCWSEMVRA